MSYNGVYVVDGSDTYCLGGETEPSTASLCLGFAPKHTPTRSVRNEPVDPVPSQREIDDGPAVGRTLLDRM